MCKYCQGWEKLCYKAEYIYGHGDVITLTEQETISEVVDSFAVEVMQRLMRM